MNQPLTAHQRRLNALAALQIEYIPMVVTGHPMSKEHHNTLVAHYDGSSCWSCVTEFHPDHQFEVIGASKGTYEAAMIAAKNHIAEKANAQIPSLPAVLVIFEDDDALMLGPLWRRACLHGKDTFELDGMPVTRNDLVENIISCGSYNLLSPKAVDKESVRYEVLILQDTP